MRIFPKTLAIATSAAALTIAVWTSVGAQQATDFFKAADPNGDGIITRDELRAAMTSWLGGRERATQEQLARSIEAAFPEPVFMRMISPKPSQTPKPADVEKMVAALPSSAPAKPA